MRDRYDLDLQLLADPDGEVTAQFSGTEQTNHGLTGIAATYVVDSEGLSATNRSPTALPTEPTATGSAISSATTSWTPSTTDSV